MDAAEWRRSGASPAAALRTIEERPRPGGGKPGTAGATGTVRANETNPPVVRDCEEVLHAALAARPHPGRVVVPGRPTSAGGGGRARVRERVLRAARRPEGRPGALPPGGPPLRLRDDAQAR